MWHVKQFESFLKDQMDHFRRYRKASNKWNKKDEANLCYFSRYIQNNYPEANILTQEMVGGWCSQRETESPESCLHRTGIVRSFIGFLNERNLSSVKPPNPPKSIRPVYKAFPFDDEILDLFFKACDALCRRNNYTKTQKLQALMVPVFFRLLFSTGMRTTEGRLLRREDVDFETGVVSIKQTKGHIEHYAVLPDSMLEVLRRYDLAMDKLMPKRKYLFNNWKGEHLSSDWVSDNFNKIWNTIFSQEKPPIARAYDFRHEFISRNIDKILDKGIEADDELTYLMKYVGHSKIESTRRYYSIRPALAGILEEKSNSDMEKMIGKGVYNGKQDFENEAEKAQFKALDAKYKKSLQAEECFKKELEEQLEDEEDLLGKGAY